MRNSRNNVAYIDGANLYKGILKLGWKLDYQRFRIWLADKFEVKHAYLFVGFIPNFTGLYRALEKAGFILVFKQTVLNQEGDIKGNCDAELVLTAVIDFYEKEFDRVVLVTGDGDFECLARFLSGRGRLRMIVAPNRKQCSSLIRHSGLPLSFLDNTKEKLAK